MKASTAALATAALLATKCQANEVPDFKMICNKDNTLTVNIPFHRGADIIKLEYGSCTEASEDYVRGLEQNATSFDWEVTLDVTGCGMDSNLRTLQYGQNATFEIGRKSRGSKLVFSVFSVDSACGYKDEYIVKYGYGKLSTDDSSFGVSGGLIELDFEMNAYNDNFTDVLDTPPTKGGHPINIGITLLNPGFDYCGKSYVPTECTVFDANNNTYTLFSIDDGCKNDDVDFELTFDSEKKMFQLRHTLFLMDSYTESEYTLQCTVKVCDNTKTGTECQAFGMACLEDGKFGTQQCVPSDVGEEENSQMIPFWWLGKK